MVGPAVSPEDRFLDGRIVAVKKALMMDGDMRENFQQEVQIMKEPRCMRKYHLFPFILGCAALFHPNFGAELDLPNSPIQELDHPNICRVYESCWAKHQAARNPVCPPVTC